MDTSKQSDLLTPAPSADATKPPVTLEKPKAPVIDVSKLDPNVNQVRSVSGQTVTLHREPISQQDVKDNLAFYRVCAGLSQRKLGKFSGFGQPYIGLWESLRSPYLFNLEQAKKLCKLLNAPLEHLDPRDKPFSVKDDLGGYRYRNEIIKLVHPPRALIGLP